MKLQNIDISVYSNDPVLDPHWIIQTFVILSEKKESWRNFRIFQNLTIFSFSYANAYI